MTDKTRIGARDLPGGGDVPLLIAEKIDLAYGKGAPVVRGASIEVRRGDAMGIAGESGSGKSTFSRALMGELTPVRGEVRVQGRPWPSVRRKDPERLVAQMVYQDPYSALNPHQTARQAVAEALGVTRGVPRGKRDAVARDLLRSVGLPESSIDSRPVRLSGGQRQRIVIARALACEPGVLIADEPTSALDVSVQAQILNLLIDLRESRGLALVVVSHDLAVLRYLTETCLVMYRGEIVESGRTADIFERPQHEYTRELVNARR